MAQWASTMPAQTLASPARAVTIVTKYILLDNRRGLTTKNPWDTCTIPGVGIYTSQDQTEVLVNRPASDWRQQQFVSSQCCEIPDRQCEYMYLGMQ